MNDDESEQQRLARLHGLEVETVGDIVSGKDERGAPPPAAFALPVLEGYPFDFPEPGIYFGMDEDTYHAIPALSTGGIKKQASSPMLFWATCPWLNPDWAELKKEEEERRKKLGQDHFDIGKAYHARLLEGREAFDARFAVSLDKKDYPDALGTDDEIRAAFPEGIKPRGKTKRERFEHLQTLDGTVQLWDDVKAEHEKAHPGKCFIPFKVKRELEKAAAIIECDPELGPALRGGYAEVSLFWICATTGVPMKCRADKLKLDMILDLKTLQNSHEASIENAVRRDIANRRYVIQPAVYLEGVKAVRQLVRKRGASAIFAPEGYDPDCFGWAMEWAAQEEADWLFLYQQKGVAPVARGIRFPTQGTLMMFATDIVTAMKKRTRQFADVFGTDPWMDSAPIYDLADEDLPNWALEI